MERDYPFSISCQLPVAKTISTRYYRLVIISFACKETAKIFQGNRSSTLAQDMQQVARRKLKYLHEARTLDDFRSPPGNRLEPLRGSRKGQHCIRINDQWRICFVWRGQNTSQVEIVDYH